MFFCELGFRVRVVRKVANNPRIIHSVSRGGDLCVIFTAKYLQCVLVADFIYILSVLCMSEPLRFVESIVVDFWLAMMMRRITGPPPRQSDGLSYHQLRVRVADMACMPVNT